MTGIIVTGHGTFAGGIYSVAEMLVGRPTDFITVEFHAEDSPDTLTASLKTAIASLSHCKSILIFCDITGGSPFNAAMQFKMESDPQKALEIIGGVNIPMIIETIMTRQTGSTAETMAEALVTIGQEQIRWLQITAPNQSSDEEEYDE